MKVYTSVGLAVLLVVFGGISGAYGADKYWDLDGATAGAGGTGGNAPSGNWNTTTSNWTTDPTGSIAATTFATGDNAIFSAGTNATGSYTATVTALTVGNFTLEEGTLTLAGGAVATGATSVITINNGAKLIIPGSSNITAVAGGKVILDGGTIENTVQASTGPSLISSALVIELTANGGTLSSTNLLGVTIVQTGTPGTTISGPGSLTKAGAGVLAIATTGNTYTGSTIINDGELRIRTNANVLPVTTPMIVNASGILNLNNVNQQVGSLTGTGVVGTAGATLTVSGTTSTTFDGLLKNTAGLAGSLTTGNGRILKDGTSTLTLTNTNLMDGTVTVRGGVLAVTAAGSLCGDIADINVNGGTLLLNQAAEKIENLASTIPGGTINLNNSSLMLTTDPVASTTYSGIITGSGGLQKDNVLSTTRRTLTLSGNNTYTGNTIITGGLIGIASANALGSTSGYTEVNPTSALGAELTFTGQTVSVAEPIRIAGAGSINVGAISATASSNATLTGPITLIADAAVTAAGGSTMTFSNANAFTSTANESLTLNGATSGSTISGKITLNGGSLTKSQSGTWALANPAGNDYSGGTIINSGRLLANNTSNSATGSGTVTVNSGGTLGGTGSVSGAVTVVSGGHIAGGGGGASGTLTVPTLDLQSGGKLTATLGVGTNTGKLDVSTLNGAGLNGGELEIATTNGFTGGTFRVMTYSGTRGGTGLLNSTQAGFEPITIADVDGSGFIDVTVNPIDRTWVADTDGSWVNGLNWSSGSQPNGPGSIANFATTIPNNPDQTVTIDDADKTVGVVNLNNSSKYTIAASGANKLVLDTWGADGQINASGAVDHEISAPLSIAHKTNIAVAGGQTLKLSGAVTNAGGMFNVGAGSIDLASTVASGSYTNSGTGNMTVSGTISNGGTFTNAGAGNMTVSGTIAAGGTYVNTGSGSVTLSGPVTTTGAMTVSNSTAGPMTISGLVSGTSTLTNSGTGTVVLSNIANNYTGNNVLNSGTLAITDDTNLGVAPAAVAAANITFNGGTLKVTPSATDVTFATNRGITVNGAGGTLNIDGSTKTVTNNNLITNSSGGTFTITGGGTFIANVSNTAFTYGKWAITGGSVWDNRTNENRSGPAPTAFTQDFFTLDNGTYHPNSSHTPAANKGWTMGPGGGTFDTSAGTGTMTITNGVAGPGSLTKIGTQGNLTISSANSFAGALNVFATGGTTTISAVNGFTGTMINISGSTLTLSAANTFSGGVNITGGRVNFSTGSAGSGIITITPAANGTNLRPNTTTAQTLTNNITSNVPASGITPADLVAVTNANLILSGQISGAGPLTRGVAENAGTITLNGDNSGWTGGMTLSSGVLALGHKNALGTQQLLVNPTGRSVAAPTSFPELSVSADLTGASAVANNITINNNTAAVPDASFGVLTIGGNFNLDLNGVIADGTPVGAGINKNLGTGTLTLRGNNTYTGGTTVTTGKLLVSNTSGSGTGSGAVTVKTGATLGGTGNMDGPVTIESGGILAPGASPGTLSADDLTLNSGSVLNYELGTLAASDKMNIQNSLTISGGSLNVTAQSGFNFGAYPILDYGTTVSGAANLALLTAPPSGYSWALVSNVANTSIDLDATIKGDYSFNGVVDAADFAVWRKNQGTLSGATFLQGDGDGDGDVDDNDYAVFRSNFGLSPTPVPGGGSGSGLGGGSVPEPGSVTLVGLACIGLLAARRRGK